GGGENVASRDPLPPLTATFSALLFGASSVPSFWEEWYSTATDNERLQVLQLAREQGVVSTAQLPPREPAPARRSLLADLLAGPGDVQPNLPPVQPVCFTPFNEDLSPAQRLAVARALGTPDLALVRGYPGPGKSAVVTEVLRQASRAGLRTLFVARSSAGLDVVLERLGEDGSGVVRCLAADESLAALPASVARLTLPGRIQHFEQ